MIELPEDINYVSRIADWIELQILFSGNRISKNKIISLISDVEETTIDSAIQELSRRLSLYGSVQPYEIIGNVIIPKFNWKKFPELTMCLIFSTHGAADAGIGTKLFERLTKECIDHYFGFESINFGFPSGLSFKSQVDSFAESCYEERGDDPSPFDKDRGADLVGFKKFGDSRNSHIYFLVQCAAGGTWRDKKSIPIPSWRRFISWNQNTTVPAMAICQIIESEKWTNAVDDYGVIIDRARLFRMMTSKGYKTEFALKKQIQSWCKTKLN